MARFQRTATKRVSHALRTASGRQHTVLTAMLEGGSRQGMLWSMDNPSTHDGDMEDLGISTDDYAPLPPASGPNLPLRHPFHPPALRRAPPRLQRALDSARRRACFASECPKLSPCMS